MYYVYLIQCNDGSFYTGVTSNLKRRFIEHKTKSGGWHTKLHKAVKVLYTEEYPTKNEALKREKQIKGWRREKKYNLIKTGKPIIQTKRAVRFLPPELTYSTYRWVFVLWGMRYNEGR